MSEEKKNKNGFIVAALIGIFFGVLLIIYILLSFNQGSLYLISDPANDGSKGGDKDTKDDKDSKEDKK